MLLPCWRTQTALPLLAPAPHTHVKGERLAGSLPRTLCGLASSRTWDITAGGSKGLKAGSSEPVAGCNFTLITCHEREITRHMF